MDDEQIGFTPDAENRLSEDSQFTYQYDDQGRLTKKTDKSNANNYTDYAWDHRGLLLKVQRFGADAVAVEYAYDVNGRRTIRKVGAETTVTHYDGQNRLAEFDAAGKITRHYLIGPGVNEVLAVDQGGNTAWALHDQLGSVTTWGTHDGANWSLKHQEFDAFGNVVAETSDLALGALPTIWAGHQYDAAVDLYHMQARWYDPRTGQFISLDPTQFAAGDSNLYRYTGNNPTNSIDPSGLDEVSSEWFYWGSRDVYWTTDGDQFLGFEPNYRSYTIGTRDSSDDDYVNISSEFGGGRVLYQDLIDSANTLNLAAQPRMQRGADQWQRQIQGVIAGLVASGSGNKAAKNQLLATAGGAGTHVKNTAAGVYHTLRHPIQTGQGAFNFIARPWNEVESDLQRGYSRLDALVDTPEGRGMVLAEGGFFFVLGDEARYARYLDDVPTRGIRFPAFRPGDSITKALPDGSYPPWFVREAAQKANSIQGRYWISRATQAGAGEFSARQLTRMRAGFAPQARVQVRLPDGTLEVRHVSKELHHNRGNRGVPPYDEPIDLREVWPWQHMRVDANRHTGYEFVQFVD